MKEQVATAKKKKGVKNVLKRVSGLIARTASSSKEARTSAYQACRLIREHGLLVVLPESAAGRMHSAVVQHPGHVPKPQRGNWWGDIIDDFDVTGGSTRVDPFRAEESDIYFARARYAGVCKGCKKGIKIGDQCAYVRSGPQQGAYHAEECAIHAQK